MKKILLTLLFAAIGIGASYSQAKQITPELSDKATNFIIASDLGRNGYYDQKPIARIMGEVASEVDAEFVVLAGDPIHFGGVASVNDPLWMTNYELIYDHPELMLDWFTIMGNHEYNGNTQAVLDYANVSRRWNAPGRYYAKSMEVEAGDSCLILFIDTTPLIDKYRNSPEKYPDAVKQDMNAQLSWIDSQLKSSKAKWKIVIGHHPVYAYTPKDKSERDDMQARLAPMLEKYGVDAYFCGHIHNFQHIQPKGSKVDYIVNSSASLSRKVQPIDGTIFCNPDPGFTVCSITKSAIEFLMINQKQEVVYRYSIGK